MKYFTLILLAAFLFCSSPFTHAQPYIIPVVFHVLHQNGAENISDAQIHDAMRILNEDFNKRNADTAAVIPPFKNLIGNAEIEFRLATLDPNGNPTNGIDRINTPLTNLATDSSRINQWNPHHYLNIWTVKSAGTTLTDVLTPAMADSLPEKDGIAMLGSYIGSIETGSIGRSRALTHNIGHYLNLMHTWGDDNNPLVVCGDDEVGDTPETKGWLSCPSAKVTFINSLGSTVTILSSQLDSLYAVNPTFVIDSVYQRAIVCNPHIVENYQNFMEYSYCSRMFTHGQVARMHDCLNSTVAHRDSLWMTSNLIETGVISSIEAVQYERVLSLFPNPAAASFTLKLSSLPTAPLYFQLYDALGRQVKREAVTSTLTTVQRSNLSGGIYFWQLQSENKILERGKVVLE